MDEPEGRRVTDEEPVPPATGAVGPGGDAPATRGEPGDASSTASGQLSDFLQSLSERREPASRYRLEGRIAQGGMGEILRVWDQDLRRWLAMKVVVGKEWPGEAGSTPDERTVGRFLDEAQVTGQLDHPGVVPVHELGVDRQGRAYFTMRLVKGRDLRSVFELARELKEDWTPTRALNVLLKACEALAYAHSRGVVHRDLKPANIMVGRFGEVYVMDWGLARVMGRADRKDIRLRVEGTTSLASLQTLRRDVAEETPDSPLVTMDGDVVGTPAFMSPEQARGEVHLVDARSDVYSMGAILYELLTGQMPYVPRGAKMSGRTVLGLVLQGPPRPVHVLSDAAPELEAICEKAMARERGARYADVVELANDLRAYLEGRVVKAHRTGALIELRKWMQRNKGQAAAIAAAVLFAVVGLGGTAFVQMRESARRADLNEQLSTANRDLESQKRQAQELAASEAEQRARADAEAERASSTARFGYFANIRNASSSLDAGNYAEARRSLDACPTPLRAFEWGHLNVRANQLLRILKAHDGPVSFVVFSPEGDRLATAGRELGPRVWDVGSGEESTALLGLGAVQCLAFSRDATEVLVGVFGSLSRWSLPAGGGPRVLGQVDNAVQSMAIGLDGRVVVSGSAEGIVRVWSGVPGDRVRGMAAHQGAVLAVALTQRGTRMASGGQDQTVRVWEVPTLDELVKPLLHHAPVLSLAFAPNGGRLASGDSTGVVRLWDAPEGKSSATIAAHDGPVFSVCFSPDGVHLATGGGDGRLHLWDVANGEPLATFTARGGPLHSVAFAEDGLQIACGDDAGNAYLWDARATPMAALTGRQGRVDALAFSADGTRLAAGSADGTVRVWDAVTGEILATSRGSDAVTWVAFAPDETRLSAAGKSGAVRLWDLVSDEVLGTDEQHVDSASSTASSDGKWMAIIEDGGSVSLRDAATGEERRRLEGHEGRVGSIAFSTDSVRLASAGSDGSVRLWDVSDGEQLAALVGHESAVCAIAFAPDGTRLASASEDGSVRLWFSSVEPARTYWNAEADRRAVQPIVDDAFDRRTFLVEVLEDLNTQPALTDELRGLAIQMARARGDPSLAELNSMAWAVVRNPNASREARESAFRQSEAACSREPENAAYLHTLGIAHYRLGHFSKALSTLKSADASNRASTAYPRIVDLAFLAMCHERLGNHGMAGDLLIQARSLADAELDHESLGFLREAEQLVGQGR